MRFSARITTPRLPEIAGIGFSARPIELLTNKRLRSSLVFGAHDELPETAAIVGGHHDDQNQRSHSGKRAKFVSYRAVIANARTQLEWLLRQLNEKP